MYRKSMPPDQGMIFWFAEKENHSFWMHNTCIPLDMLYLDDDGLIVGIEENTPTISDDTFEVGCPSRYVLELNAGWTRAHGVTDGAAIGIAGAGSGRALRGRNGLRSRTTTYLMRRERRSQLRNHDDIAV